MSYQRHTFGKVLLLSRYAVSRLGCVDLRRIVVIQTLEGKPLASAGVKISQEGNTTTATKKLLLQLQQQQQLLLLLLIIIIILGQTNRTYNNQQKLKHAKLWTLLSRLTTVKLKESEKKDKYQDHIRELKKLWNMKVTFIPIAIGALGKVTKGY